MRLLLDTHAFIWYALDDPKLSQFSPGTPRCWRLCRFTIVIHSTGCSPRKPSQKMSHY